MTAKLYELTPAHRKQLKPWADKWIANAMATKAMTAAEKRIAHKAVLGLYAAAKLPPPKAISFASGPITGAIAAGVAAGVWHLRKHPEIHGKLFGRDVKEPELLSAIAPACDFAVRAAMGLPVRPLPPLSAATYTATRAATEDATGAATYTATGAATFDATEAATYTATRAATYTATRAATYTATGAATYTATGAATYTATRAATEDATEAATRDATYAATEAATYATDPVVAFLVATCRYVWRGRNGGNHWSGWCAHLSFFRHIAKLPLNYDKWDHYEQLALHSSWRWTFADFCIVSDRPETLLVDDRNRPHCADGPSHKWRDGWALYYWHGVKVSERLIMRPESYTADEIKQETNSEVVRALAERLGWDKFLHKIGATPINVWTDPKTKLRYELLETTHQFADGQARWLKMRSPKLRGGSQPTYLEPVHPALATAKAARRWQCDPSEPSPEECNANPHIEFAQEA